MKRPVYPLLFAIFPVLALHLTFWHDLHITASLRLAAAMLVISGLLVILVRLIIHDWNKAALITCLLLTIWNYYKYLCWYGSLVVLIAIVLLAWKSQPGKKFTYWMNMLSGLMMIILVMGIVGLSYRRDYFTWRSERDVTTAVDAPDIYFIILDSYTGSEILLERFDYDNTPFENELKAMGFKVGDCQSHYRFTAQSMASTMNLGYVPENKNLYWDAIYHSKARQILEGRGYETVAFATGFTWDEINDADYYYQPGLDNHGWTAFEILFLEETGIVTDLDMWDSVGEQYRANTSNLLEHLADAATLPGPQFVFAHIIQPHPPFVFDADGNAIPYKSHFNPLYKNNPRFVRMYLYPGYTIGYIDQVEYISNAILVPLQNIIDNSEVPPVIILAGDHGAWFWRTDWESRSILCAVYGDGLPLNPPDVFESLLK